MVQNNTNYGGIGVLGLLGIVFVVLQLTNVISWPWIWVLSPFWIPLSIWLAFIILVGFVAWLTFR